MNRTTLFHGLLTAAFSITLVAFTPSPRAQGDNGQGDQTRDRLAQRTQDPTRDRSQDRLQDRARDNEAAPAVERIHARIDASGMGPEERAKMHENLNACVALGIPAGELAVIFPGEGEGRAVSTQMMLRMQNRVMLEAQQGLNVDPILSKFREGRIKNVPEPQLEQACERMENYVREANHVMLRNTAAGVEPVSDRTRSRSMQGELARQMWRGMNESGYDRIRERAQQRLQNGGCDANDLVAAGEVATRLVEGGVGLERACEFAGDALDRGYHYTELRQIQLMVAARHQNGHTLDELVAALEYCVDTGMGPGEMQGYMLRHGWMGPGDMYGPGGTRPIDAGGPHGGQGQGGNDGMGGNGGGGKHQGGGNQPD